MFGAGAYRLLPLEAVGKWTKIAEEMFPLHRGKIECFASDWLGRLFAVDTSRLNNGEPQILLLEPGTGEALEIPESFISFHNIELTEYADAALAVEAYQEWCSKHGEMQSLTRCAGYRIPLFLGGEDTVENMEDVDMEVYWSICASLFSQATTLKEGQVISDIMDIG